MTSIFNALLVKLQDKLVAAIPDSADTPGIRLVDQDFGQVDIYEVRPAVSFPCVLVDYSNTEYVQKQFKAQWAEMNIVLRLAFDPWSKSSSLSPMEVREKALKYFEIEQKIYLTLQDWTADGMLMLPLKRMSAVSEKREDKFRVRQITFKATYEDRSLQGGGIINAPINPAKTRIDWVALADTHSLFDNRLKGKSAAHITHVSWEGNDVFQVTTEGVPTAKQVKLDNAAGSLTFLNEVSQGDHVWCEVLND